jgi:hypothetical protein
LTFRRIAGGPPAIRQIDLCMAGFPPLQFQTLNGHWLDQPFPPLNLVQIPPGLFVDHDCDGITPDVGPLPGSSNFFPGVRVERCGGSCAGPPPQPPVKRLTLEQAVLAQHGVLPAQVPPPDGDGDGFGDDADNCPGNFNPRQGDQDDDSVGDVCDNCPFVCNVDQANADGDAAGDACDCSPFDPTVFAAPVAIDARASRTSFAGDVQVFWASLDPVCGSATDYDVLRGTLSALLAGGYPGAAICVADNAADTPYNEAAGACLAPLGDGCWYLLRGQNSCGAGTYANLTQIPPHPLDGFASPCP